MGTIYHPQLQDKVSLVAASGPDDDRGGWDASGNVFPSTGGSGVAGAIEQGNYWLITVSGTLGGTPVSPGWTIRALIDAPGQTALNWAITAPPLGGGVTSVFGRTDAVVAATNDYTWAQIDKTTSSLADLTTRSAADLSSGVLLAARMPALTGDVTTSAGSVATTIANNAVTLTKMANMATASFLARNTAGTGIPEVVSIATAKTMLDLSGTNTGDVTLAGENYLSIAAQVITANPINLSGSHVTSTLPVAKGGTGQTTYTNGQLLIGNTTGNTLTKATLTGTSNQVIVTNGTGSITLSLPQDIHTGASPSFVGLTLSGNANISGFVGHPSYASQTTGWRIDSTGGADFRYLFVDEMYAKSFIVDLEQALAGGQIITKSVGVLGANFTAPAAGATATLTIRDLPSAANMAVFESGDYVRLRTFSRAAGSLTIADCWGIVTSYADQAGGLQTWTFTRGSGANAGSMTAGTVVQADAIVLDYGVTGNGFYEVNAIDGVYGINSPYAQIVTWTSSPIAANQVLRTRFGNLRGVTGVTDEYGMVAGTYSGTNGQYFRASNSAFELHGINLLMWDGSTNVIKLDRTAPSFAIGSPVPSAYGTGTGIWMGKDSSAYKFRVGVPGGGGLFWDGTAMTVAGWTVNAASISNGTTYLASSFDPPSSQHAWFGKNTLGVQGWQLRDTTGKRLGGIVGSGSIYPYISVFDGTRDRVIIGGLNNAWGSDGSTDSVGMKIWNAAGTKLLEFSDVQNVISGWTIGAAKISSTGIDINSGASAGLAFGTTPPTSASAGTGIWLDRTGLYCLDSGASSVVLDSNGIGINTTLGSSPNVVTGAYKNTISGTTVSYFAGWKDTGSSLHAARVGVLAQASHQSTLFLEAYAPSGLPAEVFLQTFVNGVGQHYIGVTHTHVRMGALTADPKVLLAATGTSINASTALQIDSTTGAFLPPRMTTTQRDALTPSAGFLIYNTSTNKHQGHNGTTWSDFY